MSSMRQEIENLIALFRLYERPANQEAAKRHVPSDDLLAIAQAKYESCPKSENDGVDENGVIRDMFLLETMTWFKTEFFTWVDSPECPHCKNSSEPIGSGVPTMQESLKSAGRVELFTCKRCFRDNREVVRFPRYNDPVVLLETRKGRCGEWANCFSLICRALGYEVRYVRDWTDHVWVEVFSCGMKPNRWVHVDPCENSYDNPFLYEAGWGKKLSYIIAVSQDDIQDVTWRYIQDKSLQDVLSRRTLCSEVNLVQGITQARQKLQAGLPKYRQDVLEQRLCQELAEFFFPRVIQEAKDSETLGRLSGSVAWRLARQELGDCLDGDVVAPVGFQWNITEKNIRSSKFCLVYDSVKDQYSCETCNGNAQNVDGWEKGTFESQNMFRKKENDWKMVYLARKENSSSPQGKISWKFYVSDQSISINVIKISLMASVFHTSAKVRVTLTDEEGKVTKLLDSNTIDGMLEWSSLSKNETAVRSSRTFVLSCEVEGGDGHTAWQHAQLFRSSTEAAKSSSFGMKITFETNKKD